MKKIILALVIVLLSQGSSANSPKELHGIRFAGDYVYEGEELVLQGVALKRHFFIKAFVAGLYLGEPVITDDFFENVPIRIEVSYFVNIPGKKLSKYTRGLMRKNVTKEEYQSINKEINMMNQYFVDLKPGDRYALTYIPEIGTQFEYNGDFVGVIPGKDFANGLFSTWIGVHPMDKKVKQQILGLAS